MERLKDCIDKQISSNHNKNIFTDNPELFQFINETVTAISDIKGLDDHSENILIEYAADKAISEFYRVNQYYSFNSDSKKDLKNIYADLIKNLRVGIEPLETISENHYQKLKNWLKNNNPFAEKIYEDSGEKIEPVACSEYKPELQIKILNIELQNLKQPVLDIGCGSQANLVKYLRNMGFEAFGIDRHSFDTPYLTTTDWLKYEYGNKKWGTVVSNLGFSNHFNHHNLRADGNYMEYGKTYMEILHSLKVSGCFHYAPDVPFIEKYLDSKFALKKYEIEYYNFKTTVVKRLK
ncbi:MAG: hypothetical protein JXR31_09340 [Prolixibacteraceae bacterium]|nr:hypothetical protein [Prolixibacteraceae bacterium]MBN2774437.1 hypothetical protein [Prolixibacteraceae bacterium]